MSDKKWHFLPPNCKNVKYRHIDLMLLTGASHTKSLIISFNSNHFKLFFV
jgi:hypothetical protein